jgi:hypothetical protein
MDRRGRALVALLFFVLLTAAAIAVSGSRPHPDQGTAPAVLQGIGYLFALAAGVLLLAMDRGADRGSNEGADDRWLGVIVTVALGALVLVDGLALATDSAGATIGAGLVRLVSLVAIGAATVRLAIAATGGRRSAL